MVQEKSILFSGWQLFQDVIIEQSESLLRNRPSFLLRHESRKFGTGLNVYPLPASAGTEFADITEKILPRNQL